MSDYYRGHSYETLIERELQDLRHRLARSRFSSSDCEVDLFRIREDVEDLQSQVNSTLRTWRATHAAYLRLDRATSARRVGVRIDRLVAVRDEARDGRRAITKYIARFVRTAGGSRV